MFFYMRRIQNKNETRFSNCEITEYLGYKAKYIRQEKYIAEEKLAGEKLMANEGLLSTCQYLQIFRLKEKQYKYVLNQILNNTLRKTSNSEKFSVNISGMAQHVHSFEHGSITFSFIFLSETITLRFLALTKVSLLRTICTAWL